MTPPAKFPNVVCWNAAARLDVTNTVALSVRPAVFDATHFPSPIHRLNPATTPPTTAPYSESELLADFLGARHERLFCVAVGDSGTGKSHLIRWLWQQAETKVAEQCHIVRIPRHAANLADVLRLLTKDFHGEVVARIQREIERTIDLTPQGAMVKVLNELAFVLGPANREQSQFPFPDDEMHRDVILPFLPAMLGDAAIRNHLNQRGDASIVARLAKHVMGSREERLDTAPNLKWAGDDLIFPVAVTRLAGAEAKQLAEWLLNDGHARACTAEVLNSALAEAWPALVGLQRGNLRGAMLEIRRELKASGKELLLFLEDLSVSQGMDAELIEALIVKPSEENGELCVLRSIVGVTSDDFRTMRENILSRIDLAVTFDVRVDADSQGGMSDAGLADFASRYLNASRYSLDELDAWHSTRSDDDELPSFCEESHCPNRSECHRVFGDVEGRGLYPFNRAALVRLYRNLEGEERTAFNPRLLVKNVLREFLDSADTQVPSRSFPGMNLREWFRLREVGADVETRLIQKHRLLAPRVRTAIEIYSEQPGRGQLPDDLAEKFGLPGEAGTISGSGSKPPQPKPQPEAPNVPPPRQDAFDVWFNEKQLDDGDLNRWRKAVFDAMNGARDWDSDPLGPLFFERFRRAFIHFEGQHPNQAGDVNIVIKPSAEIAVALRGLVNGIRNPDEALFAAHLVDEWTEDVCRKLKNLARTPGTPKPLAAAVHLLALGALVRGIVPEECGRQKFLEAMFEKWPSTPPATAVGATAWNQLQDTFHRWGPKLREWLLRQIGGGKGGQVGAGMIDTAQILDDVVSAKRVVRVDFAADFGSEWDKTFYEPVLELARRVTQHLEPAIEHGTEYCRQWLALLDVARGEYSPRDLGDLLKKAFTSGLAAAAFNNQRVSEFALRCEQFAIGSMDKHIQSARGVVADNPRNHRLRQLAQLDRAALDEAAETLKFAQTELQKANELLERKFADGVVAELAQLETQVREKLADLRQQLQTLVEDSADE
jgi:hypothetical protein